MSEESKKFPASDLGSVFAKREAMDKKKKTMGRDKGVNPRDLEVALAVIMVDLASCDGEFDQSEYGTIVSGMMRVFGTAKDDIRGLVNQAQTVLQGMRGTTTQAAILKQNLSHDEKIAVMGAIDDLIASDGVEDGFETYLRARTADQLGLPPDFDSVKAEE